MAIVLTSIGSNQAKTGSSLAITVPVGGVPAGALIIVCAGLAADVTGITDSASNTYTSLGTSSRTGIFARAYYTYATAGLVSGNTITVSTIAGGFVGGIAAFYATGAARSGNPTAYTALATNNSNAAPSVGPPIAVNNGAVFAVLATNGPLGDTFTQDVTPDVFVSVPVRNGSTGASAGSNCTVAGGSIITSGTPTYTPVITSRPWAALMTTLRPFGALTETLSSTSAFSGALARIRNVAGSITTTSAVTCGLGKIRLAGSITTTSAVTCGLGRLRLAGSIITTTSAVTCGLGILRPVCWDATRTDDPSALSNANQTITGTGTTGQWHITLANGSYSTGKYYLETSVTQNSSSADGAWSFGIVDAALSALNTYLGAPR